MPTIEVKDPGRARTLRFNFPADWQAIEFDQKGSFHLARMEKIDGQKAVDILAAPSGGGGQMVFIEVKDYRGSPEQMRADAAGGKLWQELVRKAVHSISTAYLGVTVGYDLVPPATDEVATDLAAFRRILCAPPQRVEFIFWLEQDQPSGPAGSTLEKLEREDRRKQRQNLETKIRGKLDRLGIIARLAEIKTWPAAAAWQVISVA